MSSSVDPDDIDRLRLRQIIADIDQKRIDSELKRAQLPLETKRYTLQLVATVAGAFAAGGAVVGAVIAAVAALLKPHVP